MKQTLLRIAIPKDKELRGSDFRELLAKNTNLPERFFHYENGKPKGGAAGDKYQLEALPPICIVSGKSWVGVLAQPSNEDLMDEAIGKAIRIASERVDSVCKAEVMSLEFDCAKSQAPITYWVREMVLKRRNPHAREMDIETLVKQRLERGLERLALKYGFDLPSLTDMDVRITKCERPRGLAIRTTTGTTKEYATLVDVEFTAFADLKGMWAVGNLTARGYGRITRFREKAQSAIGVIK